MIDHPVDDARLAFTSSEACSAAGVSYRQLDYWTRCGAIAPSITPAAGCGSRCEWSIDDVARLARIAALRRRAIDAGLEISVATIGEIWTALAAGRRWGIVLTA